LISDEATLCHAGIVISAAVVVRRMGRASMPS